LIQKEKIQFPDGRIEDREMMCRTVIEAAKKRSIEILTSAFCLVEVCKDPGGVKGNSDKLKDYFENDYILLTNVDRFVAERARELMMAAYSKIKPPDAVHLATAAISPNVDELHTFDGRLLNLDGLINKEGGGTLKICNALLACRNPDVADNRPHRPTWDLWISHIRLSDKTSRLHPRHVTPKPAQAYEPDINETR
jgi:predicted nucleic acid-binding protein